MANKIILQGNFNVVNHGYGVFHINKKIVNGVGEPLNNSELKLFENRKLKIENYRDIADLAPENWTLQITVDIDQLGTRIETIAVKQDYLNFGYDRIYYNNYITTYNLCPSDIVKIDKIVARKSTNFVHNRYSNYTRY